MNILLIAPQPFYQDRGTPIAVKILAQTLGEQGHNIHLLVYHEGNPINIPKVTIHRSITIPGISNIKPGLSLKKIFCDIFVFLKCITLLRRYKIDIIHAVEESAFMAIILKKLYNVPYIYDMDSCMSMQIIDKFPSFRIISSLMERFERAAARNSIAVLAVCQSLKKTAKRHAPKKHIAVIEDIPLVDNKAEGSEILRDTMQLTGLIIMYVGNLEKYQGIDLLLNSFKIIHQTQQDANLVIIGGAEKDIELYKKQAISLGIGDKTFFCGSRPIELLGYYLKQADILVSPRTQGNNTPMKIYSYLDSGCPVLATRLTTHTQVLDDSISKLVAPAPETMAKGLCELLSNPSLRDAFSQKAAQKVAKEYSIKAYKNKLSQFYDFVTKEKVDYQQPRQEA